MYRNIKNKPKNRWKSLKSNKDKSNMNKKWGLILNYKKKKRRPKWKKPKYKIQNNLKKNKMFIEYLIKTKAKFMTKKSFINLLVLILQAKY